MTNPPASDSIESPENESLGRRAFPTLVSRLEAIQARVALIATEPSGMQAADDEATVPFAISNTIEHLLASASDHLDAMRDQLENVGVVRPFALYTLMRSSVEATSLGLWILLHGKKAERIKRQLLLQQSNRADLANFARSQGRKGQEFVDKSRERLEAVRSRHKSLQQWSLEDASMPSLTDVIIDVQRRTPERTDGLDALTAWRACSGIAHSNFSVTLNLVERRRIGEGDANGSIWELTAPISVLAGLFETSVYYLDLLVTTYEERSRA